MDYGINKKVKLFNLTKRRVIMKNVGDVRVSEIAFDEKAIRIVEKDLKRCRQRSRFKKSMPVCEWLSLEVSISAYEKVLRNKVLAREEFTKDVVNRFVRHPHLQTIVFSCGNVFDMLVRLHGRR